MIYAVDMTRSERYTEFVESDNQETAADIAAKGVPGLDVFYDILNVEEVICSACGGTDIESYTKSGRRFLRCKDCNHLELVD